MQKIDKFTTRKNINRLISDRKNNNKEIQVGEEKGRKNGGFLMGDNYITIRTRNNYDNMSIIEVKLPNPYLNINRPERNVTIEYQIQSKFKSPYSDYINHSLTYDNCDKFNYKHKPKKKKANMNRFHNNIHFTKTNNK